MDAQVELHELVVRSQIVQQRPDIFDQLEHTHKLDGLHAKTEVQATIQSQLQVVELNVLVANFEVQMDELHDQYDLQALIHLLISFIEMNDWQALMQIADLHCVQFVQLILTLDQIQKVEFHETLDSIVLQAPQPATRYEEMDLESDSKNETMQIKVQMMDEAIYEKLKLDMSALEDRVQTKTPELQFEETDLKLDLRLETTII